MASVPLLFFSTPENRDWCYYVVSHKVQFFSLYNILYLNKKSTIMEKWGDKGEGKGKSGPKRSKRKQMLPEINRFPEIHFKHKRLVLTFWGCHVQVWLTHSSFFFHHNNKISLMVKTSRFLVLYLIQAACLWLGLEVSTALQGDALKVALQEYWLLYYAIPLATTGLVFKDVQDAPLSALVGWTERQCLAAYSEGQAAWRYNQFAFFFRRRWILWLLISFILIFLSLHTVFFPALDSAAKNLIILFLSFLFLGTNFFALRRRTIRMLALQEGLHQLAHQLRNEHSQLLRKLAAKE
ncbi:MAG: hypothetical protein D3910_02400, partial [Candidatus Electrothrix sp. ATG2]|nr:hypothetical protein [Candidatus Electrothrix sp. ATG2]